jgi:hypothetical protein
MAAAAVSVSLRSDKRAVEALSMPPVLSHVTSSDPLLPLSDNDELCLMAPVLYQKALEWSYSLVSGLDVSVALTVCCAVDWVCLLWACVFTGAVPRVRVCRRRCARW